MVQNLKYYLMNIKDNYPLLLFFFTLLICFAFTEKNNFRNHLVNEKDAKLIISNYLNTLEIYCEDYKDEHRIYIENHLLVHPSTYFVNDIYGIYNYECEASLYFLNLKQNQVKISFEKNFTIENCEINGEKIFGTKVIKTVKEADGTEKKYQEFIQLFESKNQIKIVSTISNLFQDYETIKCSQEPIANSVKNKKECQIFDQAEKEYANGNQIKALEYYKLARSCDKNLSYIEEKINELNTVSRIREAITTGNNLFQQKEFNQALTFYNVAKQSEILLTETEKTTLDKKISTCQLEISFASQKRSGDFYYKKKFYDKALLAYTKALKYKPADLEIIKKKKLCEQKINGNYIKDSKQHILYAQKLIENQKYGKGAAILMKYRQSDLLNGKHLFYMAQIIDNPSSRKQVKKSLNLSNRECCVIVRQLITEIEDKNDGTINMDDFYFFKSGLNGRSLRCK